MVFRRRDKQPWGPWLREWVYPRNGWTRAFNYIMHRVKRLPDTPHKIALGFAIGAAMSFSPFFGFHIIFAAMLAFAVRGNVLASVIGTFFGNPLTFPFIGVISYRLGLYLLGLDQTDTAWHTLSHGFGEALQTLRDNLMALFTPKSVSWQGFDEFFHTVFMPYLVGGAIPAFIVGALTYFVTKPLIKAYQKRRKGRLVAKWNEIRAKALAKEAKEAEEKDTV